MANVYCKYCGDHRSNIHNLTSCRCRKNPHGEYHVPYEGEEKSSYVCIYCGEKRSSILSLTNCRCRKNPYSEYHEPQR